MVYMKHGKKGVEIKTKGICSSQNYKQWHLL